MSSAGERAWLVDLDGTLYRAGPVKIAMAMELLLSGREHVRALRIVRHEHERSREHEPVPDSDPFRMQIERAALRLSCAPDRLLRTVEEWMIARPGRWIARFARRELLAEIAAARARGVRTALVSDYPARVKIAALGADALFDYVVANGEPGGPPRLKPAPDGYCMAARALGIDPAECLVIGDRADADGEAARRAGMRFRLVR